MGAVSTLQPERPCLQQVPDYVVVLWPAGWPFSLIVHLYSAAWSAVVATSLTASGCLSGGVLAAVAAGLRGRGDLMPSKRPAACIARCT